MSLIKLTEDLSNFKWTNYENVGNSQIPQTFDDGRGNIVTGKQTFERPSQKALEDMESEFGPISTEPETRGSYGIADYMDGTKKGRGFIVPGGHPLGFTTDMKGSKYEIGGELTLTPLSYTIAGMNSSLDYGVVPEQTLNITPILENAWGSDFMILPIENYVSKYSPPTNFSETTNFEEWTQGIVGGGVLKFASLMPISNYPQNLDAVSKLFASEGQRTLFNIPEAYPYNTLAFTLEGDAPQFGFDKSAKYNDYGATPPALELNLFSSGTTGGKGLISRFYQKLADTEGFWPYNVLPVSPEMRSPVVYLSGDNVLNWSWSETLPDTYQPYVRKNMGDRYGPPGERIVLGEVTSWLTLIASRTGDDSKRIESWLKSPIGKEWRGKQVLLQGLNPREETRDWSEDSILSSLIPAVHATRHSGGGTYMGAADFGPIIEGDPTEAASMGGLFGTWFSSTGAGKLVGKWSKNIEDKLDDIASGIGGAVAGADKALGGFGKKALDLWASSNIDFNAEGVGGRLKFLTGRMIYLTDKDQGFGAALMNLRSSSTPFGRPPKVPTQVVFSQKGAYGAGSAAASGYGNTALGKGYSSLSKFTADTGEPTWVWFKRPAKDNYAFVTSPYSKLQLSKSGWEWGKAITPYPVNNWDYAGDMILDSWRFLDPDNKQIENVISTEDSAKANFHTKRFIENRVFTLNKKSSKFESDKKIPSDLLKRYSTLAYGAIPTAFAKSGQIKDDATHGKYNYEKTLRSAGELNLTKDGNLRPDWLKGVSAADGSGVRDNSKKIVDGIGQQGRSYILGSGDKKLFSDETWDAKAAAEKPGAGLGLIKGGVLKSGDGTNYANELTDKINILPYGQDYTDPTIEAKDFIKFKFFDVYNKKFLIFRALLSGISDSISPEWTDIKYIGRPDKVYVYQGADRKISFTFDIYPKTKQEFPVLLEKLNYLVGLCYPSFEQNRMVAPFINLTIGDMFKDTPGFLGSLNITVEDNTTWELDEGLQFPKYIKCACDFTYIGKYMPSSLGKHYELPWLDDQGWQTGDKPGTMATFGTFRSSKDKGKMKLHPEREPGTYHYKLFSNLKATNLN